MIEYTSSVNDVNWIKKCYYFFCEKFLFTYFELEILLLYIKLPHLVTVLKRYHISDVINLSDKIRLISNLSEAKGLDFIINANPFITNFDKFAHISKNGVIQISPIFIRGDCSLSPFFWPIYLKNSGTSFSISIYDSNHSRDYIFNGTLPTQKTMSENVFHIALAQKRYFSKKIIEYFLRHGH
jgi:hypothetical protein